MFPGGLDAEVRPLGAVSAMSAFALDARARFDCDEVWAALPPTPRFPPPRKGSAGQRLTGHFSTSVPEPLLREFARDVLGACRFSRGYLPALRVVLGNQAHAERSRHTLEQNVRVEFATERAMRTINRQMEDAGITEGKLVTLGAGRVQTVQCFTPDAKCPTPSRDLCDWLRLEEDQAEARWGGGPPPASVPASIVATDIPY
jgi:hypothetical protein